MKKTKESETIKRARELYRCEGEVLKIFKEYRVTLPEAVFLFEKIKFSSMLAYANTTKKEIPPVSSPHDRMFG
jgi:hypothetical protein